MDKRLGEVVAILEEVAHILRGPNTNIGWSSYNTVDEAVAEIDQHITRLKTGDASKLSDLTLLFAPTGNFQEIALSSGWGERFLSLAARFDKAIEPHQR